MDSRDYARMFPVPYKEDIDKEQIVLDLSEADLGDYIDDLEEDDPEDAVKIAAFTKACSDGEIVLPAKIVVCPLCNGKGKHVNPSIDAHGISAEEFYEDPDFREDYFSGVYDVSCYRCHGKRVCCEVDRNSIKSSEAKVLLDYFDERIEEDARYNAICAAERRMGA